MEGEEIRINRRVVLARSPAQKEVLLFREAERENAIRSLVSVMGTVA